RLPLLSIDRRPPQETGSSSSAGPRSAPLVPGDPTAAAALSETLPRAAAPGDPRGPSPCGDRSGRAAPPPRQPPRPGPRSAKSSPPAQRPLYPQALDPSARKPPSRGQVSECAAGQPGPSSSEAETR
ncbi:hypothetical protein H8958_005552, partial [Nasalis larvatus]